MAILNERRLDPNKILPMKYLWARQYYKMGVANNWVPEEVPMQNDIEQWRSPTALTEQERRLILWNLGFFSTAESLTANNIVLGIYNQISNPECRQYLLRQAYEEAVHTDTFIYCCDSLHLDPEEIYNMYQTIPSIKAKDEFVLQLTNVVFDPGFQPNTTEKIQQYLNDLIGYYVIMEGIFFYAGFAMMLALKRKGLMVGVGEQFDFIMRDESVHLAFGCDLINTIIQENPQVWTQEFQDKIRDLIQQATQLEAAYAQDACPEGIVGINSELFVQYVRYIADKRLERINLKTVYGDENPFPWMSSSMDLNKEKNFFETRVTEYQQGGNLDWN